MIISSRFRVTSSQLKPENSHEISNTCHLVFPPAEIADSIPRQIKALHPDLPNGAKLVLSRIPSMHGHAYVYPLGLDFSIERFYPGRSLQVIYGSEKMDRIIEKAKPEGPNTLYFNYIPDRQAIVEIESR
jgi:hypothetical protein